MIIMLNFKFFDILIFYRVFNIFNYYSIKSPSIEVCSKKKIKLVLLMLACVRYLHHCEAKNSGHFWNHPLENGEPIFHTKSDLVPQERNQVRDKHKANN